MAAQLAQVPSAFGRHFLGLVDRLHLLPQSYTYGFAHVLIQSKAFTSYLIGTIYPHPVWFYFPVAMLVKSTLTLSRSPRRSATCKSRGMLLQEKNTAAALHEARQAEKLSPDSARVNAALVQALDADEQPQEAVAFYQKAPVMARTVEPRFQSVLVANLERRLAGKHPRLGDWIIPHPGYGRITG